MSLAIARPLSRCSSRCRHYSSARPPPEPRPFGDAPPPSAPRAPVQHELPPPPKESILSRIFGTREPKQVYPEQQDPARGLEAAQRFVRQGIIDPRYKEAGRKYQRLIIALPLAIYLSYELYRRRFLGVEQKKVMGRRKEDNVHVEDGREG